MNKNLFCSQPHETPNDDMHLEDMITKALRNNSERQTNSNQTNILLLDDDEDQLFLMNTFLSKLNLKVITANDVFSCIERLTSERVDLIVMDNMLPKINGSDFLKLMRKTEQLNRLPILPVIMVAAGYVASKDLVDENKQTVFCYKGEMFDSLAQQITKMLSH